MENEKNGLSGYNFEKIVEILIRLGMLFVLITWCFDILRPFFLILIWAVIITTAIHPTYKVFVKAFRGKRMIASVLLIMLILAILIIPSFLIMDSLYSGLKHIHDVYNTAQHMIPPPGEGTANWPPVTKPIVDLWRLSSENLHAVLLKYPDQVKVAGKWLLSGLAGLGIGILQFVASILIAGVLLFYYEPIASVTSKIFQKLAGKNGEHFVSVSAATVMNVMKGILGVAAIQSGLAGIGFFAAGVPYAGFWTIISLILSITQVGIWPVAIPVAVYMFSVTGTYTAIVLAIWLGIATVSDNVLRPILMGHKSSAPILVIFLGSMGGFLYYGFLGLFLGAVVLTIGYELFLSWLEVKSNI